MTTEMTDTTVTVLGEADRWRMEHNIAQWCALVEHADGTPDYDAAFADVIAVAPTWSDRFVVALHNQAMADRDALWATGAAGGWDAWDAAMRASGMHEPILDSDDVPLGPPTAADYAHDIPEHYSPF